MIDYSYLNKVDFAIEIDVHDDKFGRVSVWILETNTSKECKSVPGSFIKLGGIAGFIAESFELISELEKSLQNDIQAIIKKGMFNIYLDIGKNQLYQMKFINISEFEYEGKCAIYTSDRSNDILKELSKSFIKYYIDNK